LTKAAVNRWMHQDDKILIYTKGDFVFVFNFHPTKSFDGYFIPVGKEGRYRVVLSTDDGTYGGFDRIDGSARYEATRTPADWVGFSCYVPCRSAFVLKRMK
ncbi:MAG: alpha amylase C-terminal domain-containing protein, partial [Clostridia bacterium]|nr:alpha amylase C-terminal domain-containing protein [Clostridia bacterium]